MLQVDQLNRALKLKIMKITACALVLLLQAAVTARGQVNRNSLAGAARDGDLARVKSITSSSQGDVDLEQKDDFFREETAHCLGIVYENIQ